MATLLLPPIWKSENLQTPVVKTSSSSESCNKKPTCVPRFLSLEHAVLSAHVLNNSSNKFLTLSVHLRVPWEPISENFQSFAYSSSGGPAMLLGVAVVHFSSLYSICASLCRYKNISKTLGSSQRYNSKSK